MHELGPVVRFAVVNTEYRDYSRLYQDYLRWRGEVTTRRAANNLADIPGDWGQVKTDRVRGNITNGGGVSLFPKPVDNSGGASETGGKAVAD